MDHFTKVRSREEFQLSTGTLALEVTDPGRHGLFKIAERQNPKRAFLFVSTVLGRHIPVRPQALREAADGLAERVAARLGIGPVLVMSYAETAVGLGLGVFDGLRRRISNRQIGFLPTTRFRPVGLAPWFETREDHSHAVDHMILPPARDVIPAGESEGTLVLVDDETTTGNTFAYLADGLARMGLGFKQIIQVVLTDWSDGRSIKSLAKSFPGSDLSIVSLLRGRYSWSATPGANARPLPALCAPECPVWSPPLEAPFGVPRTGITAGNLALEMRAWEIFVSREIVRILPTNGRVLVIGTGEHVWYPFLAAEQIERAGFDVGFIATTRSPVVPGSVIRNQICFPDHFGIGLTMYLNNVDPEEWDEILLFTETGVSGVHDILRTALGKGWIIEGSGSISSMSKMVA